MHKEISVRRSVALLLTVGAFLMQQSALAGHIRVVVAPWRLRPIVLAPRVVVAPVPVQVAAPAGKGFVDLTVTPLDSQVWVDGEYVGIASHFSGDPKYLKLMSGSHTVLLAREGFVPQRFAVTVEANRIITLDVGLLSVGGGSQVAESSVSAPPGRVDDASAISPSNTVPATEEPPTYQLDLDKTGYLALTVVPSDASLYIDDEPYGVVAEYNGDQSIVLRAGPHKIQIVRPGYLSNIQTVEIVADTTQTTSINLTKE
jgi:hypothetical protein